MPLSTLNSIMLLFYSLKERKPQVYEIDGPSRLFQNSCFLMPFQKMTSNLMTAPISSGPLSLLFLTKVHRLIVRG